MSEPTGHPDADAIVVLAETVTDNDPSEIVQSNIGYVNALLAGHLKYEEIAVDALRSYYVDYYLDQCNNGGFSQFVYNSRWNPRAIALVRDGLQAMGARRHLAVFDEGAKIVAAFGQERLAGYFKAEYFGENADRDALNAPVKAFAEAEKTESLVALNAAWLRSHPKLRTLPTLEAMGQEARHRTEMLPDLPQRIAAAQARQPRYLKLIRALCSASGHKLERVTAGDPAHVHEGARTVAWHFITDHGHHYMVDTGGKAIMFRGSPPKDRICEVDAP